MKLVINIGNLVNATDNWFEWADKALGKDRKQCSLGISASGHVEITIHTPEYIMLYLYYLKISGVNYIVLG